MAERNKKRECVGGEGVDLERLKCRTLGAGRLPSGPSVNRVCLGAQSNGT